MNRRTITVLVIVTVAMLDVGLGLLASWSDHKSISTPAWVVALSTVAVAAFTLGALTRTVGSSVICSVVTAVALSFGIYLANETGIQTRTSIEITPFLGFVIGVFYFGNPRSADSSAPRLHRLSDSTPSDA